MRPDWPPLKKICHAQWLQVTSVPVVCHCALPESSSGLQTKLLLKSFLLPVPGLPLTTHQVAPEGVCVHRLTRDLEGEAHLVPDEVQPLDAHGQPWWPPGWGPGRCGPARDFSV